MSTNLAQLASGVRGAGTLAGLASSYNPSSSGGALSSLGAGLGNAANGLGILQGINQGGVAGYGSAAVNAGQLANRAGAFGDNSNTANGVLGTAGGALQMYNGINQGGISGYGSAGIGALRAGSGMASLSGSPGVAEGLGDAASYAAIPLDIYNEVNNWKSGATTSDAMAGATTGAAIGSVVPVIGTAIGALVGGAAGALSSLAGPGRTDPETEGVQQLINATGQYGNTQQIAQNVQNPYLELAGLMDERSSTLPEYQQYGRMGEQKFTDAMTQQINQAIQKDPSLANNPQAVYNQVVSPWVESMGTGSKNVGATYNATNQGLLQDMTSEYLSGQAANDWKSIGGQSTFSDIYQGSPISAVAPPMTQSQILQAGNQMGKGAVRTGRMADGGRAKRKSVLDSIRPNFSTERKTNYDDGGYVNYSGPASSSFDWFPGTASAPDSGVNSSGVPTDIALPDNSGAYGMGYWNDAPTSSSSDSSGPSSTPSSSSSGGGGLASLAKSAAPYAALLPLLSAAASKLGGSGSSSSSGTPAGQSTAPTGPFQPQVSPRTANAIDPNTDWYTYGQHPETQFFSNNSIGPLMGKFAAPQASAPTPASPTPGTPPGTANTQPLPVNTPRPSLKAQGGALGELDEEAPGPGQSRHVRGAGDGTSDDIDAKLSDGEYVIDANTVSMLGNGSNEAGAKRLDQLRENLRKHAAKPMAKGKQFMKAKAPEAYMKGGKKKSLAFDVEGEG